MTSKDIFENFSGIDPEFITDGAPRAARTRSSLFVRIAAAAACLCLIFGLGFGWIQSEKMVNIAPNEGRFFPAGRDEMIWAVDQNPDISTDEEAFMQWKGFTVEIDLYDALEKNTDPEKYFAVTVTKQGQLGMKDFLYQGTTLGELDSRMEAWDIQWKNMMSLEKEGLWLRFGEALYTTGIPTDVPLVGGDKWSESLYWETVARYGEEMLAKYIVDGEFLSERLVQDREVLEQEMEKLRAFRSEAYGAFKQQNAFRLLDNMQKQKLAVWYEGGNLYLFVTEKQIAKLKLDKDEYTLSLTSREAFEHFWAE